MKAACLFVGWHHMTFGHDQRDMDDTKLVDKPYNYAPYNRLIKRSPSKRNKTDSDSHQQQIRESTS